MARHKTTSSLAAMFATAACMLTSNAVSAAVACNTFSVPIAIPNTAEGIYVNFATGVTGTSAAAVPGFDFNPWGSGGSLRFYMGADADANNGAVFSTVYEVLTESTSIGPASTFSGATATATNMAPWLAGTTGYLGVRFTNNNTAAVNYGWVSITTTGATGFPATLNSFCFENTGAAITAGTLPVSLMNFSIE